MTKRDLEVFWALRFNARIRRFKKDPLSAPIGYSPSLDSTLLKEYIESIEANPVSEAQKAQIQKRRFMCATPEKRLELFASGSSKVPSDYNPTKDLLKIKQSELSRNFWSLPLEKRIDLYDEGSPVVPEDYYPSDDSLTLLKITAKQKMEKTNTTAPIAPKRTFVKNSMTPQMLCNTWYEGDLIPEASTLFSDEFNARINKPILFKVLDNKQNQIVIIAGNDRRLIKFVTFEMGFKIISTGGICKETKAAELNDLLDRFNKVLEPIKTRKYVMLGEFEA